MNENNSSAVSCVECQRRKQKCDRKFPCNHCLKRGVSHLCRVVTKHAAPKASENGGLADTQSVSTKTSRKRKPESFGERAQFDGDGDSDDGSSDVDTVRDVVGKRDGEQSEELKTALLLMPAKPYTDCLVDNWLNGANYHYYVLYPPEFRTQYDGWWASPTDKATPELTSLIMRVCACSLQFIMSESVKRRLEWELKADVATFSNRMHTAAEKLSATIPPGKGGLIDVQQLLLTAFWYKSGDRWTDAWHALGRAVREANEIGLHQDSVSDGMSEFDREMRRRMWVLLNVWDFALSSMLCRPFLISHADCTAVMPTLTLEINPERPDQPSPFRHIILHYRLSRDIAAQLRSDIDKAQRAQRLRDLIYGWLEELPAEYALRAPDTRWDKEFDWVVFQRRFLHVVGYKWLFDILRPFITQNSGKPMTELEAALQAAGVHAALDLVDTSWLFFETLVSVGARFHCSVFCVFDTSCTISSAVIHDDARNLPQRETVLETIIKGLRMLEQLRLESKTSAGLYHILKRLVAKLPLNAKEQGIIGRAKRARAYHLDLPGRQGTVEGPFGSPSALDQGQSFSVGMFDGSSAARSPRIGDANSEPAEALTAGIQTSYSEVVSSAQAHPGPVDADLEWTGRMMPMTDGFFPLSSIVPPFPATTEPVPPIGGVMSDEFGYGNEQGQPAADFQFGNSMLGPTEAHPVSQTDWDVSRQPLVDAAQGGAGNLAALNSIAPQILEFWDWEALGLGDPASWMAQQPLDANGNAELPEMGNLGQPAVNRE